MGEGNIFNLSTLARGYPIPGLWGGGGGVPHPRFGGLPCPRSVGVPHPQSGWGGTPSQVWMGGTLSQVWVGGGVLCPRSGWLGGTPPPPELVGVPPPPPIRQSSIASTCYGAGSVPLAFTQEDFLVWH